jgi:iron complex transport system substrate-binding protein
LEAAACDVLGPHVKLVSLRPNSLADIWADIERIADALGDPARGERLVASLQERLAKISAQTQALPERPRIAFVEWIEPLMAGGNWVPELIAMANAVDLLGKPGEHSDWIEFDQLRDVDPDVILVAPCGFDLARTIEEMPSLVNKPGFSEMRAVKDGRVYVADGNAYFNRPGPRLVESFEILAEILYDGHLDFGHRDVNWKRYPA